MSSLYDHDVEALARSLREADRRNDQTMCESLSLRLIELEAWPPVLEHAQRLLARGLGQQAANTFRLLTVLCDEGDHNPSSQAVVQGYVDGLRVWSPERWLAALWEGIHAMFQAPEAAPWTRPEDGPKVMNLDGEQGKIASVTRAGVVRCQGTCPPLPIVSEDELGMQNQAQLVTQWAAQHAAFGSTE